jgi:hypothetical protein
MNSKEYFRCFVYLSANVMFPGIMNTEIVAVINVTSAEEAI